MGTWQVDLQRAANRRSWPGRDLHWQGSSSQRAGELDVAATPWLAGPRPRLGQGPDLQRDGLAHNLKRRSAELAMARPRDGLAHNLDLGAVDVVSFIQWAGGPTAPQPLDPARPPPPL